LLVVLQAMDAAGKDSTVRSVFEPINPQGCTVTSFKAPSSLERSHDFLWRIHHTVPARGMIGVFNRSHYEDVLIARVRNLVPDKVWKKRYDHINDFEHMLHDEGVVIRKFFLHISKDYQRERLALRLADPEKHWKFNPADLDERELWPQYQKAYDEVLTRCSTPWAPWYIVPAEKRWFRNLLITEVLVHTLRDLKLKFPKPTFDPATIVLR
jgi:PPK2 family polyphosphate:nucleotide phosphotransferase